MCFCWRFTEPIISRWLRQTCIQSTWFLCLFVILKKRTGIEQEPLLKKSRHRQGWPLLINNVENALTSLVTFTWDLTCSSSEDNVLGYLGGCSGRCFLSSSVFTSTNIQLVFKRPYVWRCLFRPKNRPLHERKCILLRLSIWKESWVLSHKGWGLSWWTAKN